MTVNFAQCEALKNRLADLLEEKKEIKISLDMSARALREAIKLSRRKKQLWIIGKTEITTPLFLAFYAGRAYDVKDFNAVRAVAHQYDALIVHKGSTRGLSMSESREFLFNFVNGDEKTCIVCGKKTQPPPFLCIRCCNGVCLTCINRIFIESIKNNEQIGASCLICAMPLVCFGKIGGEFEVPSLERCRIEYRECSKIKCSLRFLDDLLKNAHITSRDYRECIAKLEARFERLKDVMIRKFAA